MGRHGGWYLFALELVSNDMKVDRKLCTAVWVPITISWLTFTRNMLRILKVFLRFALSYGQKMTKYFLIDK